MVEEEQHGGAVSDAKPDIHTATDRALRRMGNYAFAKELFDGEFDFDHQGYYEVIESIRARKQRWLEIRDLIARIDGPTRLEQNHYFFLDPPPAVRQAIRNIDYKQKRLNQLRGKLPKWKEFLEESYKAYSMCESKLARMIEEASVN